MTKKPFVVRTVPASQFKQKFGEVIRRVYEHEEILMIERAGMPVAFLTSVSDFEQTHPEMKKNLVGISSIAKRQRAANRLRALMDSRPEIPVSAEEIDRDIQIAVDAGRYGKRKKK